ncbi:hypothetical protein AWC38_SpisGene2614 [Stylophora pistillata]|uniref:Uncharacterized protein n=1 Tax=Stylophora pistillata TaxID=50429 RepID=A0A2B4SVN6_STYPI|nr:hypothetical protein AWC38_SpisGene2614 [Stylophora pistillata]
MSATPEPEKKINNTFAETEPESFNNVPTAEGIAEPLPEWSKAIDEWGIIWDFHQYGLDAINREKRDGSGRIYQLLLKRSLDLEPETAKPTAKTETTPKGKYRGWAEAEPSAEPTAETQLEWERAVETWRVRDFTSTDSELLFGAISLLAFVTLVKIIKRDGGARQKKVSIVVLTQIFLFGSTRCLFLCIDAYLSKRLVSAKVMSLI